MKVTGRFSPHRDRMGIRRARRHAEKGAPVGNGDFAVSRHILLPVSEIWRALAIAICSDPPFPRGWATYGGGGGGGRCAYMD